MHTNTMLKKTHKHVTVWFTANTREDNNRQGEGTSGDVLVCDAEAESDNGEHRCQQKRDNLRQFSAFLEKGVCTRTLKTRPKSRTTCRSDFLGSVPES